MQLPYAGAIDCDVHVAVPDVRALFPYFDEYWQEQIRVRGIDRLDLTSLTSYPPNAPLSARPDWRPAKGAPGTDLGLLRAHLDAFRLRFAICNCLHGAQALYSEDMAAAFCRAINDWLATEWLDREPRLRASIVVPPQNPELAAEEIARRADDPRFVQVLLPVMADMPLGRRLYWPIYREAERHGLPVGIHAGSLYRHAPTPMGWPSTFIEDYAVQAQAFDSQLLSLIAEGVFTKFPRLTVVLMESGITWLPCFLWRTNKIWRGVRAEVPWVHRQPADIIRDRVRLTLQPTDEPPEPEMLAQTLAHIGADRMLLFATDFPHWHFDGVDALPDGLPEANIRSVLIDNPQATYPRLAHSAAVLQEATT